MSRDYGALRLWSTVLMFVGTLGVIFVVIGIIFAVIGAATFWQGLAILLIGGPLAALFASWPRLPTKNGRCRKVGWTPPASPC